MRSVAAASCWALGSGWHEPEFEAFDFNFGKRVSVFDDSLQVIVPLLREGKSEFYGDFAKGVAELRPAGPRAGKGGPPILIAGTKPRMMSLIARHADRWNSCWYGLPTDEFRTERSNLKQACADIERDAKQIDVSVGIQVCGRAGAAQRRRAPLRQRRSDRRRPGQMARRGSR